MKLKVEPYFDLFGYTLTNIYGEKVSFTKDFCALEKERLEIIAMTDEEFLNNLPKVLHFSVIMVYLRDMTEEQRIHSLSDVGLIHQIVHLLHIPDEPLVTVKEVRDIFKSF